MTRIADPTTKTVLLRAAEDLFAERGVAAVNIQDIADKAGLSSTTFLLHFGGKEEALRLIAETWFARCTSLFAGPRDYPDCMDDPHALLDFVIERDVQLYDFFWQSRATLRILNSCRGEFEHRVGAFKAELQRRCREWLEQWRRDGLVRPEVDVELGATLMSGAYEELTVRMLQSEQRPPLSSWLEFAQETFVRAFGTPEFVEALGRRNRRATTGVHSLRRGVLDVMNAPTEEG